MSDRPTNFDLQAVEARLFLIPGHHRHLALGEGTSTRRKNDHVLSGTIGFPSRIVMAPCSLERSQANQNYDANAGQSSRESLRP